MSNSATPRLAPNKIQRWLALPFSVALGGLLVAVALISLGARSAAAAGLAEPAVSYPCSEAGLNSALAAGGSATFSCPAPHTVTVSAVKVVNKDVSLDGGNQLILSGGNLTRVFTVAAGVHLKLINFTLRDANGDFGAAVYNNGLLAVIHTQFISNSANYGAAVYNAPGAQASIANSTIARNFSEGGAIWNGGNIFSNTVPATLTVASSTFETNSAAEGAAIFNQAGPVSASGSTFQGNQSSAGGAIFNSAVLQVDTSQFDTNSAGLVLDSQAAALGLAAGLNLPSGSLVADGGGAIYAAQNSHNLVASSTFTGNAARVGGAIFNTSLLTVDGSTFIRNTAPVSDTASNGGAIASYPGSVLTVSDSAFTDNQAFEDGGAIFNSVLVLATVRGSDFTHNTAVNDSGGAVTSLGVFTVTTSSFTGNYGAPGTGTQGRGGGAIYSGPPVIQAQGPSQPTGPNGGPPLQAPAGPGASNRLVIDHVRFDSNSSEYEGGAIDGFATAINASMFNGNTAAFGGAIDVLSDNFVISGSTFTNNAVVTTTRFSAYEGGAIDTNSDAIKVTNSTFYGNRVPAGAFGSHFGQDGEGGAIQVQGGFMAITNSTFLSNTAGDAGFGGAFADDAHLIAHNLLIAFNAGGNCQTSMTLTIHDIDYPGASCSLAAANVDPRALAPANNGGPTLTSALLPGSPAINGADNIGCPSTDQRGAKRPVGGTCDIGAFEFGGSVPWLWLALVRR